MKTLKILALLLSVALALPETAEAEDPVQFADGDLKQAVIEALAALDPPIITDDPTPADMLNLTYLHAGGRGIADLTGLEYALNLSTLNLGKNENIADISPLGGLTTLEKLILIRNQISDITPLTGLSNLSYLSLSENQISNITPLAQLSNLTFLSVGDNPFTNIDPFLELTNLWGLSLDSSAITDISWLAELGGLTELFLSSNPQITDFSVVSSLSNLTTLALGRNQITDISFLTSLTQLQCLYLSYNSIIDISVIGGLPDLTFVDLSYNLITDISPLSIMVGLTGLRLSGNPEISDFGWIGGLSDLTSLELRWNDIGDISFVASLPAMSTLGLEGNQISDVTALTQLYQLQFLDLRDNPLNSDACTICIPQIVANNPGITLLQNTCPDPGSVLINGGFESGAMTPWKKYATAPTVIKAGVVRELTGAAVPEGPVEGDYCLHVGVSETTEDWWLTGVVCDGLVFQAGKRYTLSAFLTCKKGTLQINFKPEMTGEPWTGYGERQFTMTDEWAEYSVTTPGFVSDVSPAQVTFHVGFADGEFWMDNVRLIEEDIPPEAVPFADQNLKQAVIDALAAIGIYTTDPTADEMAALTEVFANDRGIADLTGIEYAVSLNQLYLAHNYISGIQPLSELTNLTELVLGHNQIVDTTPLSGLTGLVDLRLNSNPIMSVAPLASLTQLERLGLKSSQISDIGALAGMTEMVFLHLIDNEISDISALSNLTNVVELNIERNLIADISPLANMANLQVLILPDNQVSSLSPLLGMTALTKLWVLTNPLSMDSFCALIPEIAGNNPYLSDFRYDEDLYSCAPTATGGEPVVPVDTTTGTAPATITFEDVTDEGFTSLTTSDTGPTPPVGFQLGDPATYYEITTSASYTGLIDVCISYSDVTYSGPPEALRLYHYEDGQWVDCTTVVDTDLDIVCGVVTSLSPFAILLMDDTEPPVVEEITATPNALWPANHKMVEVTVSVAAHDNSGLDPTCTITNVTCNEPVNGPGDGNTDPDWLITGDLTVELRAERSGGYEGRIYTVHIECVDAFGNALAETVDVIVPHDEGKKK